MMMSQRDKGRVTHWRKHFRGLVNDNAECGCGSFRGCFPPFGQVTLSSIGRIIWTYFVTFSSKFIFTLLIKELIIANHYSLNDQLENSLTQD